MICGAFPQKKNNNGREAKADTANLHRKYHASGEPPSHNFHFTLQFQECSDSECWSFEELKEEEYPKYCLSAGTFC